MRIGRQVQGIRLIVVPQHYPLGVAAFVAVPTIPGLRGLPQVRTRRILPPDRRIDVPRVEDLPRWTLRYIVILGVGVVVDLHGKGLLRLPRIGPHVVHRVPPQAAAEPRGGAEAQALRRRGIAVGEDGGVGRRHGGGVQRRIGRRQYRRRQHQHGRRSRKALFHASSPSSPSVRASSA